MSNDVATVEPESRSLTAREIRADVNLLQEVLQAVMKVDVHYGVIPGTQKPTLYKAGSEKILSTFRIAVEPEVFDLSTTDEARFRVVAKGIHQGSGKFVGSGVGEASSNEEKYKWRFAACQAEFDSTPEDRRRLKYKRDGSTIQQIRTNHADVANTVLKMAKKRAQVDLTLTATAASDVFSQDLEDLEPEVLAAVAHNETAKPPIKQPARKSEKADLPEGTIVFVPLAIAEKSGETKGKKWTRYGIKANETTWLTTFDSNFFELAQEAKEAGQEVEVKFEISGQYKNIVDLVRVSKV